MRLTNQQTNNIYNYYVNLNIKEIKLQEKETKLLLDIYKNIKTSIRYLIDYQNKSPLFLKCKSINKHDDIPVTDDFGSIPHTIRNNIYNNSKTIITNSIPIHFQKKKINFTFVVKENENDIVLDNYVKMIEKMLSWIHVFSQYSKNNCANTLNILLYFTETHKKLPTSELYTINNHHVNTAFTYVCPNDGKIVIYRKEEWFKVFIHETFHTFKLDFSSMNLTSTFPVLQKLFKITCDIDLSEAYTETWATIINMLYCIDSVNLDSDKLNDAMNIVINVERQHSLSQINKILLFNGLTYRQLIESRTINDIYKEKTNVFSYYVIKGILMYHINDFLTFCNIQNIFPIVFKKTPNNLILFVNLVKKLSKSKKLLSELELSPISNNDNLNMTFCHFI